MDTTITNAILAGSFTTLLGIVIGHFLSESREKRSSFNNAAEQFRAAFWPEVEFFDRRFIVDRASIKVNKRICDVLFDAISRHQKAVFMFSSHLGPIGKYRFNKVWRKYCKDGGSIHYFAEEYPCANILQRTTSEKNALKRINDILKFANPR